MSDLFVRDWLFDPLFAAGAANDVRCYNKLTMNLSPRYCSGIERIQHSSNVKFPIVHRCAMFSLDEGVLFLLLYHSDIRSPYEEKQDSLDRAHLPIIIFHSPPLVKPLHFQFRPSWEGAHGWSINL